MLSSKLKAMSVGPFWVLRQAKKEHVQAAACSVCKKPYLISFNDSCEDGALLVILASPITDEAQQKLVENCLYAAGWDVKSALFSLHTTCSPDKASTLNALNEQIKERSPTCCLIFGQEAMEKIDMEWTRGKINYFSSTPFIVTHHPAEMIATPSLKAQVWADLCITKSTTE